MATLDATGFIEAIEIGPPGVFTSKVLDEEGVNAYEKTINVNANCALALVMVLTTAMLNGRKVQTYTDASGSSWVGAMLNADLGKN